MIFSAKEKVNLHNPNKTGLVQGVATCEIVGGSPEFDVFNDGYTNWLDFAVDTMDTRTEEQERLFAGESVSRQSMRDAVQAELMAIRRKAGKS